MLLLKRKNLLPLIALSVITLSSCDNYETPVNLGVDNNNEIYCKGLDREKGPIAVDIHRLDDQHCYPAGIFANPTPADKCDETHYHYTLISLDGHERHDEGIDCGASKNSDVDFIGTYYTTKEVVNNWNQMWAESGADPVELR